MSCVEWRNHVLSQAQQQGQAAKVSKEAGGHYRVVVTGPDVPAYEASPSLQHDINHVAGLADIEASLDWIAKGLARLTSDDHAVSICLAQGSNIYPVKLTLAENDFDDTMGRLVTAFERIADSLARLAGLSRPRLECWHEQNAYMPQYRDQASNGGAAGPSAEVTEQLKNCNSVPGAGNISPRSSK